MNLQENIPVHIKRRIHLIDRVIDNLLPNMYPCDYNSSNHFVEGVLDEIFYFFRDETEFYGIDLISINDFILDYKYDELTEYFNERCIVLKNNNLQESIRRILREETIKDKYKKEYINYHGNMEGFDDNWNNLFNKDFNDGGLINIPEYIELSRLVNIVGEFKKDKNIHWVRTSDEYLFYDTDWLFLSDVKINDNAKIIRVKTHKSNINLEQTIIQNLTFDYEKEITLKNLDLENYEIIKY